MLAGVFEKLSEAAARRAARLDVRDHEAAERWLRVAAAMAPRFTHVHRDTVAARRRAGDRLGAAVLAQRFVQRFNTNAEAWMLLGEAWVGAFRANDALRAYERVLQMEERADAAMAAGDLYAQRGDHVNAGARYARAFAAGGGPEALKANAKALKAAGDRAAAENAVALWKQVTGREWTEA
jgi:tetratricopeptide (TPR) repeat protein